MRYLVIVALVAAGCQTMSTKAESIGKDGSSQLLLQKIIVPPFASMAEGAGTMTTSNGPDGYKVATGQAAKGLDNTPQLQALQVVIQSFMGAFTQYLAAHPQQPAGPTLLEQLQPFVAPPVK